MTHLLAILICVVIVLLWFYAICAVVNVIGAITFFKKEKASSQTFKVDAR